MDLLLIRHLWGITDPWEIAFPRIQRSGYVGIETAVPAEAEIERFQSLRAAYHFEFVAQVYTAGATVAEHIRSFEQQAKRAVGLNPLTINCQGGKDAWSRDDARTFYREALAIEAGLGVPVVHETHRGRVFYTPWLTGELLTEFSALRLCCDLSHWVCVCERLLADQAAVLAQCFERCTHIHARVGYEEGPQVPDPRAPEYTTQLDAHERWWAAIWTAQRAQGLAALTLTPEYGPPTYQQTLPYTHVPVSALADICDWQAQRAKAAFDGDPAAY